MIVEIETILECVGMSTSKCERLLVNVIEVAGSLHATG